MSAPYHTILGIETSCDDTSIAVVETHRGCYRVISMVTASQVLAHRKTGGVVPEVAAREHAATIMPTLEAALRKAHTKLAGIDAIAVTSGPGLSTALLVGVETARTLSFALNKPLIGVNHIAGHLASCWLNDTQPQLPALALVVSGGHTELLWLEKDKVKLIGKTRDDAAGECFDKAAKLMGLPYPGGPAIGQLALKGRAIIPLPRPMLKEQNFEFSFAGLKTAVATFVQKHPRLNPQGKADLAASVQTAIVDVLVGKTLRAAQTKKPKCILLGGGVAANSVLRERLAKESQAAGFHFSVAPLQYTTDNGAMIAVAGAMELARGHSTPWQKLDVNPVWEVGR
ncbi:MAG: tRNA (adenosine(37)-N6)-threonylcarbamoyltransferase complex transferase subunit TsaD [Patescibacteria group bacterium]